MEFDQFRNVSKSTSDANFKLHREFLNDTWSKLKDFDPSGIPLITENYAVIIEPRPHSDLAYVIRNMLYFLGGDWGLCIVTSKSNIDFVKQILPGWKNYHLRELPGANLTREEFRSLRKDQRFWKQLPGKKLLCFETDTLMCRSGIEAFLQYDYVGAPWSVKQSPSEVVRVGNGGFSLRSKQTMIELIKRGKPHVIPSEDTYFSIQLQLYKDFYKVPSVELAKAFAVETLFHPNPLGLHKPWFYQSTDEMCTLYNNIRY
jgi:hypothetical protein